MLYALQILLGKSLTQDALEYPEPTTGELISIFTHNDKDRHQKLTRRDSRTVLRNSRKKDVSSSPPA
jgi:hypothetical protein